MAAHLTDKQKKKIIADYLECGSYRATADKNGKQKKQHRDALLHLCVNCAELPPPICMHYFSVWRRGNGCSQYFDKRPYSV